MADFLYRVGRFAARRHWTVIGAFLVAMMVGLGTFAAFSGTLSSAISIPGKPTSKVTDQLARDFEGASGGSGSVVFNTTDGGRFTQTQKTQIADLLDRLSAVDGVQGVTDPFKTQAQLEAGNAQLAAGKQQLEQGQRAVAQGLEQLAAAQQQLDAQREQARTSGTLGQLQQQLAAEQAKLDLSKQQLQLQNTKLTGRADALESGTQVAKLSSGFRFVSEDGTAAVATVSFEEPTPEVPAGVKSDIEDLTNGADITGAHVLLSQDISQAVPSILGPGEIAGVLIAAIVLVIMLGTALGAVLPLASAGLGVGIATLAALSFSGIVAFQSVTPVLGVMLGLAVGIDYSLFILNRHRNQLKQGMDLHESIGLANGTSGNAVVFAGATVIVALLALNITGIPFLGLMGTVGAAAVLVAIVVATTFTPAMLSMVGLRVLRKSERSALQPVAAATPNTADDNAKRRKHTRTVNTAGAHASVDQPMSTRSAILRLVLGTAALALIALPALQMRLGLPDGASQPEDSQAYQAYQVQAENFGDGFNGPLVVVATLPSAVTETARTPEQATIGQAIADQGDVRAVVPIGASTDGTQLAFQVIPAGGPNSESTADLVQGLRDLEPTTTNGGSATLGVAGNASANIDVSQKLSDALPVYLVLVVGLSFVILILVFRSLLVPLTATIGFVLSLLAAFGGITAIFQLGWLSDLFGVHSPGPILSFLPIIETGILFGLAMDYQLFLVSGMREAYAHGAPAKVAVQRGLHAGRSVVTAAAIIMISVFAGFVFSHDTTIKPIGFGLAFGVLLDAFVVRMLIIPAAMHLIGDKAWWLPRWMNRILPDVDVEGAKLERAHPVTEQNSANAEAVMHATDGRFDVLAPTAGTPLRR